MAMRILHTAGRSVYTHMSDAASIRLRKIRTPANFCLCTLIEAPGVDWSGVEWRLEIVYRSCHFVDRFFKHYLPAAGR